MDTLKVIVDMYNSNLTGSGGGSFGAARPHNPFVKINVPSSTTSNAFGAKPNPFASNASNSIFGNNSAPTTQGSVFGSEPAANSNLFGGAPSVFGGSSVFGGDTSAQPFGTTSQQPSAFNSASNVSANIFSQPTGQPSVASNNIFGNSFGASQGSKVFGAQANFSNPSASIFGGGSSAAQPTSGASIFSQPTSAFGAPAPSNVFGVQSQPIAAAQSSNIFGQPSTTQQSSTIFGAPPVDNNTNIFGNNNASMFGAPPSQATNSTNVFGQPAPDVAAPPNNPFGVQPPTAFGVPTQPPAASNGNAFGNNYQSPFGAPQQPTNSVFGNTSISNSSPFQNSNQMTTAMGAVDPMEECFYTKKELLLADELSAFDADTFDLATIPSRPPPREMCA